MTIYVMISIVRPGSSVYIEQFKHRLFKVLYLGKEKR